MKNLVLVFVITFAFSATAMAADIAFYVGNPNVDGWYDVATQTADVATIIDETGHLFKDIQQFDDSQFDEFGAWVDERTDDGKMDILWLNGCVPSVLYPFVNLEPDGSRIEEWLDGGNMVINVGDWFGYVSYEGGAREAANGGAGAANILDLASGIITGGAQGAMVVTATGEEYLPSLNAVAAERPVVLSEVVAPWEVAAIFGQNAAGTHADPVVLYNTETEGYIAFINQAVTWIDDRGLTTAEFIGNWVREVIGLGGGGNPLARRPDPEDGAMLMQTWGTLSWKPGFYAVSHDVYIGDNFDDVNNGAADTFVGNQPQVMQIVGFVGFPFPDGLVPGTTYYWRINEVNDTEPNSPWKGDVWSFWIPPKKAYDPSVSDGAKFVVTDTELGWTAGFGAKLHTVYFGDDLDTVTNAAGGLPQSATTFTPGSLEMDKTYYWRVDEFEAPLTHTGDVWSFTTVPNVPVGDPDLVAWWKLDEGGGTTVVDWSGHGNHGTLNGDPQWTDGYDVGALDLDGTGDYVDFADTSGLPAGTSARTMCGWGKTNTIAAGWRWIAAYGTGATSQAMFIGINGSDLYGGGYGDDVLLSGFWKVDVWHHICLTYDGTTATLYADGIQVASQVKTWDLSLSLAHVGRQVNTAAEFWDGLVDDVRIYNKALTAEEIQQVMLGNTKLAGSPVPARDAIVDIRDISSLNWSAGDTAASHDVYFGTDRDAVAGADNNAPQFQGNQAGTSLSLAALVEFGGGDYYWRVDEIESDGTANAGTIWKFSVPDHLIVDDFESYNDIDEGQPGSNRIYLTWIDGFGTTTNGAVAGNLDPPFMSQGRSGAQAMPLGYDNAGKISEATMTLVSKKDWTGQGVTKLVVWFRGDSANAAERMFVALGNAIVYHPDAAATQDAGWNQWVIDLAEFAGVDLTNVGSITIGFGTRNAPVAGGGTGTVHFDDIGLIR